MKTKNSKVKLVKINCSKCGSTNLVNVNTTKDNKKFVICPICNNIEFVK